MYASRAPPCPRSAAALMLQALISYVCTPTSPPAAAGLPAGAQIPLGTPASPGAAPRGAGAEDGEGLRCHLWGGVNNPSVYEPGLGIGIQRRATVSSLSLPTPFETKHNTKTKPEGGRR